MTKETCVNRRLHTNAPPYGDALDMVFANGGAGPLGLPCHPSCATAYGIQSLCLDAGLNLIHEVATGS